MCPMKRSIIPVALVIVSFLVTFSILSWQEGRWPLGRTAIHMSTPGRPERTRVIQPLTPEPSRSPWTTTSPAPAPKTAAVTHSPEAAASEETPPAGPVASNPVDAADYLAERAREASHSARTR